MDKENLHKNNLTGVSSSRPSYDNVKITFLSWTQFSYLWNEKVELDDLPWCWHTDADAKSGGRDEKEKARAIFWN